MTFFFFDHNGNTLFRRSDAIEFKHYCEEYASEGSFPLRADRPVAAGMVVAWQDEDGAWEAHEIITVEVDAYGDELTLAGCSIAVAELRCAIVDSIRYEGKTLAEALDELLNNTGWARGVIPAGADVDEDRRERYRTRRKAQLRNKAGSSGKVIGTYKKGAYVTLISKTSESWYKVEAADNRIGWMRVGDIVRDGTVEVQSTYQVTASEDYLDVWTLLEDACASCGTIPRPRVEINRSGIVGRYIDVQSKTPEFRGVRLTCNTNIREAGVKYDISQLYTAMKGVGKDDKTFANVVWNAANGDPVDKPKGQNFVALSSSLELYGHGNRHRMGVARFGDIDDPSALLRATWEQLQLAGVPRVQIDCTIADLYALGYGGQSMRLYDLVYVVLRPIGFRVSTRIEGLTKDLLRPERTQPVIGTLAGKDIVADLVGTNDSATRVNSWQIRSVSGAAINPGTVGNQQIASGAITAEKIAAGAVAADAIAANAINANAIVAGAVTTNKLAAGSITTEKLDAGAVTAEKIAAEAVEAEMIAAGAVTAAKLDAETVDAHILEAVRAKVGALTAEDIAADRLAAALADFVVLTAGNAEFSQATADHLIANTLQVDHEQVAGKSVIRNLAVLYAQLVSAVVGSLTIKASDGRYYRLDVDAAGELVPTPVAVSADEAAAGVTQDGKRAILETAMTVNDLSAGTMDALHAVIGKLVAAQIDVDQLFAREAFVSKLTVDRILNEKAIRMIVGKERGAKVFRQEAQPTAADEPRFGDIWVDTSGGETRTFQASGEGIDVRFGLDADGVLGYELYGVETEGSLRISGSELESDGLALYVSSDGAPETMPVWAEVRDTALVAGVTLLEGEIASKVSRTEYDGLAERVSSAEQVIAPESIRRTVRDTIVYTDEEDESQSVRVAEVYSELVQTREEVSLRFSAADGALDGVREGVAAMLRASGEGLSVGRIKEGSAAPDTDVLIRPNSVDVRVNAVTRSRFAGNYIRLGNMRIKTDDTGLSISVDNTVM